MCLLLLLSTIVVESGYALNDKNTNKINTTQYQVSGTIMDEQRLPLSGVNVLEKGTDSDTQNNFNVNYPLSISSEDDVLGFSFTSLQTMEKSVVSNFVLDVTMLADQQVLDKVVVVRYDNDTLKKREITSVISSVRESDSNQGVARSPMDLVRGKVAGLNITRTPLIVIDGNPSGNLDFLQQKDIKFMNAPKDATLNVSFVGFAKQQVKVGNHGEIDVAMETETSSLDEVVFVGYGTKKAKDVSTAISSVKAEDFRRGIIPDPIEQVQGRVSGLVVTLDNILDERGRELAWELWRRQDLIRYEVASGEPYFTAARVPDKEKDPDDHTLLFPIPENQRSSNSNLEQNPGYN